MTSLPSPPSLGISNMLSRRIVVAASGVLMLLAVAAAVAGVATDNPLLTLTSVFALLAVAGAGFAIAYKRAMKVMMAARDNAGRAEAAAKNPVPLVVAGATTMPKPDIGVSATMSKPDIGIVERISADTTFTTSQIVNRLTQMRSTSGRDILAHKATRGVWDWSDMERALESYRLGGNPRKRVASELYSAIPLVTAQLGDLCFRQNVGPMDRLNAATIYRIILKKHGEALFDGKRRAEYLLDSLGSASEGEGGLDLLRLYTRSDKRPNDVDLFQANFTNPARYADADQAQWLETVNAVYRKEGLAELQLHPGEGDLFLRLSAAATAPVTDGPLVSILMPVFQPDAATELAIQSALAQSYRNIELIIVDDGSGEPFTSALRSWAEQDARVTVILSDTNAGAYTSRNLAFTRAKGEYVTVFDGDDWQHPQKIEKLVAAAVKQADHRMVSAPWARVDSDLFFHYRGWRGAFITPAHVSTMFPVSIVRESLGFWDSVRKAADTEFILRYQMLVNSEDALEVTDAPMTLSLVGASNLSVDDFRLGYRAPDRRAYRESYSLWHRRVEEGSARGYMPFPQSQRLFSAPPRYRPLRPGRTSVDVLLVGDFKADSKSTELMLEHLRDLRNGELTIGVMHRPSLMHSVALERAFSDELLDSFNSGDLHRVEVTDAVTVGTVIVYDPAGFQFATALPSHVDADRVLLLTNQEPETAKGHRYEVTAVITNVEGTFGVSPEWVPLRESVFGKLLRLLPAGSLLERTWGALESKLTDSSTEVWPSVARLAAIGVPEPLMEAADAIA